jgi:predicted MFS family arabinose efflux permease
MLRDVERGPGPRAVRRARIATSAVFAVTGFVFATWAARIPAVQDRLGLSEGALGVAFLALNAGAVVGLPGGGALVSRLGSARSLRAGFALYPPALVNAALAPGLGTLVAALLVMAAANSVIDVAMNTQGAELERRYGRPVMSGLHAGHSLGVLGGGIAGAAAAAAGLATSVHFAAAAAIAMAAGQAATHALLDEPRAGGPRLALPRGRLLTLGLVAFCAFLTEGAANDWSAVHLRRAHGAGPGTAALAFVAFTLALSLGRLAGDRIAGRGRVRAVRGGAAVAVAGVAVALAAPDAAIALAGWSLLGAGVAVMAPTVLGAAATTGASAPAAIAAVTTVGYLGAFSGPPVIGGLAELVGLTGALTLVGVAALGAGVLARRALRV